MAEAREINSASKIVTEGGNIASKVLAATTDAVLRFLESRSFANREANIPSSYAKNGKPLGCVIINSAGMKEFKELLQREHIPSVSIKFLQEDGSTRYGMIFRKEDQACVEQIREMYLASKNLVFNISKENLQRFSKHREVQPYTRLTYADMSSMKDRLEKNQILYSVRKDDMNAYTVFVRKEDKDMADLLRAGVYHEKEGVGQNIYKQMDHDHENRVNTVNRVLADKDAEFLIRSQNHKMHLYVDKKGLWYEQEGNHEKREFVSRSDDNFEKKLCDYVERMRNPLSVRKALDKETEILFKERFESGPEKNNVMALTKALELYGLRDIKELRDAAQLKSPPEKMKEAGVNDARAQVEYEAAYCRLRTAIDFGHTEKDNGRVYVSEAERNAFQAEQDLRKQYEYCLIRGYDGKGSLAMQYKNEVMDKDQMTESMDHIQKEKHFTVDDMRRHVVWREAYEMPDYVDKDRDGIFDEFDQDIGTKEDMEHPDPEETNPGNR